MGSKKGDGAEIERGNWTGKLDFLLSCIGYAVGLGNVWRFPYLCFKHGGGAFLIPYTIMLVFIGIPCFFLEITIGQYAAMGPVTVYSNLSPLFKGLGFANFLASAFVGLYYNMIIAWTIYYLFASFTSELPWDSCQNEYNSAFCFSINGYKNCTDLRLNGTISPESIYFLGRCLDPELDSADYDDIRNNKTFYYGCEYHNKTETSDIVFKGVFIDAFATKSNYSTCVDESEFPNKLFDIPKPKRKTAAGEYLSLQVLNESDGIENMGPIQWKLCLCLLAAWIIIFCCLIKGIKSSGKVVYFTATFPYFVLIILLIKAATLPGAIDGIKFYLIPEWSRLSDIKVWEAAAVQIFFSLSVAGGGLITLASYNKFKNNVIRDTFIVCFGNCLTSIFAGFAIFSVLGFMAKELGVEVPDVAVSGTGLAFVAYPDLVTRFPAAPFWSFLFFSMLFTLGLDSQFAIVETVLSGILDFQPRWRSKKTYIVGAVCVVGFICGLPLTTRGGGYLLDLLDYYAAGWPYLFIGLCELIIIGHIYGIQNFFDDLYSIVKFDLGHWSKTNIHFIYLTMSPAIITVILIISWANHEPLTKGDYKYPEWADGVGWTIAMIAICSVPAVAIYQLIMAVYRASKRPGFDFISDFPNILYKLTHHTDDWRNNAYSALSVQEQNDNTEEAGIDNKGANTTD
jgi:solute carrier family 6 amino acid transporter-like protein 5/7/9/14